MMTIIDPYDRHTLKLTEIDKAENVKEIEHLLCARAYRAEDCEKCKDPSCRVGKKMRELLRQEQKPQQISFLSKKNDPDYEIFLSAIRSGTPIMWLVTGGLKLLDSPPRRCTKREAEEFINRFAEKYTDVDNKILSEALEAENRKNYEDIRTLLRDGAAESYLVDNIIRKYKQRPQEAQAYIEELQEKYGQLKKSEEEKPNKQAAFTDEDIDDRYEQLTDTLDLLQEEYDQRAEEIEEEIELIDRMIAAYNGMVQQIQGEEKKLARYPEESPLPENSGDMMDALEYCDQDEDVLVEEDDE